VSDVIAIVEGETEQTFIKQILAVEFGARGIGLIPILPGRVRHRGGVRKWQSIRGDIVRALKQRADRFCTTMFDFYRMPLDWPGREDAGGKPYQERGICVEAALAKDLREHLPDGLRPERFIPYVQIHEFEALLFAGVQELADTVLAAHPGRSQLAVENLQKILAGAGAPEAINDRPDMAPSKRICQVMNGYQKPFHGPIAAQRIGLARIREKCPHFHEWLTTLEALVS
jgi:hypothetical protein